MEKGAWGLLKCLHYSISWPDSQLHMWPCSNISLNFTYIFVQFSVWCYALQFIGIIFWVTFIDMGQNSLTGTNESPCMTFKVTQIKCKKFSLVRIKDVVELWKNMMIKTKRVGEGDCAINLNFHADQLLSIL